ncbi:MAG TPA: helix-turn-helix domain-containing protein [Thermoleophilia bacterium]|nr:helix-turn-helix domain-containing protein [Thermoleophilia bacterium]
MTTRDEARRVDRRTAERERIRPEPAPPRPRVGERLLEAREAKGVDLYRAERDTKIRVKYLSALERSDFKELPGAVYTKGFLRNYALYLGLDPDDVIEQWKSEAGSAARQPEPVAIAPKALEAPRSGLTFTPGIIVAALLTLGVVAFAGYIALQLLRFSQPPSLTVTSPATVVSETEANHTLLAGHSDPGATVTIQASGNQVYRLTADSTGAWSKDVPLNKGQNNLTVTALDPATSKSSDAYSLIVTVPLPVGPESPTLTVTSPNDGTAFSNGAIPIKGNTTGSGITVSAAYQGPSASPAPGKATPKPPETPAAKQIAVDENGDFADSYQLAPGQWTLTITATGEGDKTTTEQRRVSVSFTGVDLVVEIKGGSAWIKVWVDGKLVPGYESGIVYRSGRTLEFNGQTSVEVRTGSSGVTYFTLNGTPLGSLGNPGMPETWLFQPPNPPQKTSHV